jgi:hypothetical protein
VSIFLLVVPFLRPPGGIGDTPPLPYWLYPIVGIAVFVSGFRKFNLLSPTQYEYDQLSSVRVSSCSLLGGLENLATENWKVHVGTEGSYSCRWNCRDKGKLTRFELLACGIFVLIAYYPILAVRSSKERLKTCSMTFESLKSWISFNLMSFCIFLFLLSSVCPYHPCGISLPYAAASIENTHSVLSSSYSMRMPRPQRDAETSAALWLNVRTKS